MAGAGFKTFNTGDVLTASDVNTYLMQQTVMVFASAAARTTALGANVAEGMISYLKDTNAVEVYDGSNWISSDDPNAIQNTIVDAKGDLITATANDTPARLAVGANGYTLVADSSQTTGLGWTGGQAAGRNALINGGMDIWQRGTSFTVGTGSPYTADRWQAVRGGNVAGLTVSRQVTGDTTNLPFIQYATRCQRDSGNTSTNNLILVQSLETSNSLRFAGQTVALSFYARAGANYSPTSSVLNAQIFSGTGTDQNYISGYTGAVTVNTTPCTLTTTWQRFTITGTVGATATELAIRFICDPIGTAGANDWFEITGVQLELGSSATPFSRNGSSIQGELAACQRYLPALIGSGNELFGYASSTTSSVYSVRYIVQPRTNPTGITVSNVGHFRLYNTSGVYGNPTAIAFNSNGKDYGSITVTTTAGSPTIAQNQPVSLYAADANASILFTGCEL